jgi:hypothetical protein
MPGTALRAVGSGKTKLPLLINFEFKIKLFQILAEQIGSTVRKIACHGLKC